MGHTREDYEAAAAALRRSNLDKSRELIVSARELRADLVAKAEAAAGSDGPLGSWQEVAIGLLDQIIANCAETITRAEGQVADERSAEDGAPDSA